MKPMLRQVWERFSLYIPIILMGVLALGTWWLVRNIPQPLAAPSAPRNAQEPDYFMKDFSVKSFDTTGRMQSEVKGDMARHFPATDTIEIDNVRMRFVNPQGLKTLATAHRALSNADGSEVQLFGDAVVTREAVQGRAGKAQPRMEFRSEFLHAFTKVERVRSDQPVVLIRGNDRFTADAMEYDHLDQVLQLRGRVRGVLTPTAAR